MIRLDLLTRGLETFARVLTVLQAGLRSHAQRTLTGLLIAALTVVALSANTLGADLYVSENGSDANSGTSASQPLATLQKANDRAKPGSTVWVMPGIYRNKSGQKGGGSGPLLSITQSGTPDAWITWRNYADAKPELIAQGCWQAIEINASYINIEGLIVTGNNDNVRQSDAERNCEINVPATLAKWKSEGANDGSFDYSATPDQSKPDAKTKTPVPATPIKPKSRPITYETISPRYNGNGISVDCRGAKPLFHHFVFRNLVVRNFGGGGINLMSTDYYTVENCEIYNNAWYSCFGCSGLSQLGGREFDDKPGYHNIIRNNRVWNNKGLCRVYYLDLFSDGNGMILDTLLDYSGAVLVENNLSYDNGGSGFHVFKSNKARIDVVNNTFWRNQQMWRLFDMGAHAATNVHFFNNIVVGDKYRQVVAKPLKGIEYDYNLYFGGNSTEAIGPHDMVADPMFVRPATNRKDCDFNLKPNSLAINSGTLQFKPEKDLAGTPRRQTTAPSRGAFEFAGTRMDSSVVK